jgi:hypothetical protein
MGTELGKLEVQGEKTPPLLGPDILPSQLRNGVMKAAAPEKLGHDMNAISS